MEQNNRYNFKIVEDKWQKFWEKDKSFETIIDKNNELKWIIGKENQ